MIGRRRAAGAATEAMLASGMAYVVESTRPILRVVYEGTVDDEAFAAYLDAYNRFIDENDTYAVILDATKAGVPSAHQRHMQAAFLRDNAERTGRLCVGAAFVIRSGLIRGALTATLWGQPFPFRHVVVATVEDAEQWCHRQLAKSGIRC